MCPELARPGCFHVPDVWGLSVGVEETILRRICSSEPLSSDQALLFVTGCIILVRVAC